MESSQGSSNLECQNWYVVYTKPRKEEIALFHLARKGLEYFFPRLLLPHTLRKQRRIVPLFPNYLFVRVQAPEEFDYVQWSPGVRCLVGFQGTPAPLDSTTVDFLRSKADPEGVIKANFQLAVGKEVHITGGPFAGLVAIIQDPPHTQGRVNVLMQFLKRPVKVAVPTQLIECNWSVDIEL